MRRKKIKKLAFGAMFCALILAATWISIPAPAFGNINLGDGMILLCAWILAGPWAAIAAATGAALADLLGAYAIYAPGTFLIKACTAAVAATALGLFSRCRLPAFVSRIISATLAEAVMILGYFIYEALILSYGFPAAALNIPFNAVQGSVAVLLSCVALPLIQKTGLLRWLES
ncbi:MAG: ECF transporter S component [Clostridia bacterium]|nr:ECF transporter S component [Clostridia bacterium]